MRKLILYIGLTFSLFSCGEDITKFNIDPKNPSNVDADVLFTYGEYSIVVQFVDIDYNQNVDKLWANFFTQTTYIQEASYNPAARNIGSNMWGNIYTDALYELSKAKNVLLAKEVPSALQAEKDNKLAMISVLEVLAYQYLVDNFGDIPYSEALNVNNVNPKYDDAASIYDSLIQDLTLAISKFDEKASGFNESADILYGGDIAKWKKFANSLLLKIGLRIADYNENRAKELVAMAVKNGVFASNDDNASFAFIGTQPYTNPIYKYFAVDKRNTDFVVTSYFIKMLKDLSDPRIGKYFDSNIKDGYVGGEYGANGNSYQNLTHPNPSIVEATFPGTIMDYAAVSFGLAEAVERGFITGSASEHYENAIKASFVFWGLSDDEAKAYLATPSVSYATAAGDYKQKIGIQKYIALYMQGHEAWTEARRLDYPMLATAESNGVSNPKRMLYPNQEKLINSQNYEAVSNKIGGDKLATPIFWDMK